MHNHNNNVMLWRATRQYYCTSIVSCKWKNNILLGISMFTNSNIRKFGKKMILASNNKIANPVTDQKFH